MEKRGPSAYAAEFFGTLLLVFSICTVASVNSPGGLGYTDFVSIGLVHAFVLAGLIAIFAVFSGGHFNPAVTISLAAIKKISPLEALIYIVLQVVGAIVGVLLVKVVLGDVAHAAHYGAPAINKTFAGGKNGVPGAFVGEAIGTLFLVLAVVGTAVAPRGDRRFAPLIIGIALGAAVFAIGPITGGSFNPARAFAPTLIGNSFGGAGTFLLVYILAPIVGGLIAAFGYVLMQGREAELDRSPIDTFDEGLPASK